MILCVGGNLPATIYNDWQRTVPQKKKKKTSRNNKIKKNIKTNSNSNNTCFFSIVMIPSCIIIFSSQWSFRECSGSGWETYLYFLMGFFGKKNIDIGSGNTSVYYRFPLRCPYLSPNQGVLHDKCALEIKPKIWYDLWGSPNVAYIDRINSLLWKGFSVASMTMIHSAFY